MCTPQWCSSRLKLRGSFSTTSWLAIWFNDELILGFNDDFILGFNGADGEEGRLSGARMVFLAEG